jgi:hypothetical protein
MWSSWSLLVAVAVLLVLVVRVVCLQGSQV